MEQGNKRAREEGSSPLPIKTKKPAGNSEFKWTRDRTKLLIDTFQKYNDQSPEDKQRIGDVWQFAIGHFQGEEKPTKTGAAKHFHELKKEYALLELLLAKEGFVWDDDAFVVIAPESKWKNLGQDREKLEKYRHQSFEWLESMRRLLGLSVTRSVAPPVTQPAALSSAQQQIPYQKKSWKLTYKITPSGGRKKYCQRCQQNSTRCDLKLPCNYCLGMGFGAECKYGNEWADTTKKWEEEMAAGQNEPVVRQTTAEDIAALPAYTGTPTQLCMSRNMTPSLLQEAAVAAASVSQETPDPSTSTTPAQTTPAQTTSALTTSIKWDDATSTTMLNHYLEVRDDYLRRYGTVYQKSSKICEDVAKIISDMTGTKVSGSAVSKRVGRLSEWYVQIDYILKRPGFTWDEDLSKVIGSDVAWLGLAAEYRKFRTTAFPGREVMRKIKDANLGDDFDSADEDAGTGNDQDGLLPFTISRSPDIHVDGSNVQRSGMSSREADNRVTDANAQRSGMPTHERDADLDLPPTPTRRGAAFTARRRPHPIIAESTDDDDDDSGSSTIMSRTFGQARGGPTATSGGIMSMPARGMPEVPSYSGPWLQRPAEQGREGLPRADDGGRMKTATRTMTPALPSVFGQGLFQPVEFGRTGGGLMSSVNRTMTAATPSFGLSGLQQPLQQGGTATAHTGGGMMGSTTRAMTPVVPFSGPGLFEQGRYGTAHTGGGMMSPGAVNMTAATASSAPGLQKPSKNAGSGSLRASMTDIAEGPRNGDKPKPVKSRLELLREEATLLLYDEKFLNFKGMTFVDSEIFARPVCVKEYLDCKTEDARRACLKNYLLNFFEGGSINDLGNFVGK